jgi:molybdopterin-guanine dinucleotide biosynthesis protein A
MDRSAIILATDFQGSFSEDKGLLKLKDKPLLNHVIDAVKGMVDEVLVVTASKEQAKVYAKTASSANVKFIVSSESQGSLPAALAGFEAAHGDYSLLLPFDSPLVSQEVLSLLFELCVGKSAVVSRRGGDEVEALHAVYCTEAALKAAKEAMACGEVEVAAAVAKMRGVRYLSTMVIEQLDPDFHTFFRVKSPLGLKKAAAMSKPRKTKSRE